MRRTAIAAGLVIAVLAVYWQVLGYRFINFDDDAYILNNPHVRDGLTWAGIAWAFTSVRFFYWQPLTWLSHMLDCSIYGLDPAGHHFTNVLLHAANAVLVFFLLRKLTGYLYRSAFVAALFALHPLRVESVAWIAERKDLLCGFFSLLTLLLYVASTKRPERKRWLVLLTFAAALMSKPMAVTLPLVMLLLDYWPLQRAEPLAVRIKEKAPLFLLSFASGVLTLFGQKQMGAMASLERISPASRIGNAFAAYIDYLWKTFWPVNLAIFYPFPTHLFLTRALLPLAILIAISVVVWAQRLRRPWLLTGWCWFLVMLAPTIGILQAGDQALADRFTYLPHIGLLLAIVWTAAELSPKSMYALVVILPVLAVTSWAQTRYWADSVTVAQHAIDVTGDNAVMEHNLGYALAQEGRQSEALTHLSRSIAIEPRDYVGQYNLAKILAENGQPVEAETHFRQAIHLKPDYAEAHFALATLLRKRNALDEASREFNDALAPGTLPAEYIPAAHNALGIILAQQARYDEAMTHFAAAIQLQPGLVAAEINYARCLVAEHKNDAARAYLLQALKADGENPDLRRYLNSISAR